MLTANLSTFFIFLSIVVIVGFALVTKFPGVGLGVLWFILAVTSTIFSGIPETHGFLIPVYLLIAVGFVLGQMKGRPVRISLRLFVPSTALLVVAGVGTIATTAAIPFSQLQELWILSFAMLTFACVTDASDLNCLLIAQSASATVCSAWVVVCAHESAVVSYRGGLDKEVNPNDLSFLISFGVLATLYGFYLWRPRKRWLKVLPLAIAGLQLYAVLVMASRGMTIGLGSGLAILIVCCSRKPRVAVIGFVALLAGILLLGLLPGGDMLLQRVGERDSGSFNLRLPIWNAGLQAFGQSSSPELLFGRGPASIASIASPVSGLESMHNSYLQVFFEEGLVGLVAFLWISFYCIRSLVRRRNEPGASLCLAFLGCMLISGLSASLCETFQYWIAIGAVWAYCDLPNVSKAYFARVAASSTKLRLTVDCASLGL